MMSPVLRQLSFITSLWKVSPTPRAQRHYHFSLQNFMYNAAQKACKWICFCVFESMFLSDVLFKSGSLAPSRVSSLRTRTADRRRWWRHELMCACRQQVNVITSRFNWLDMFIVLLCSKNSPHFHDFSFCNYRYVKESLCTRLPMLWWWVLNV